jgi:uncharacterized cupredoxin-like copper-binding protein
MREATLSWQSVAKGALWYTGHDMESLVDSAALDQLISTQPSLNRLPLVTRAPARLHGLKKRKTVMKRASRRLALAAALAGVAAAGSGTAQAAGDLSRQQPIEVVVELGRPDGRHAFEPNQLRFETGRLYRLVLRNVSRDPHYFTSDEFAARVFTRKVQVTQTRDGREVTIAEFKGAIREIEVYPGHSAEWWFVPIATGRITDLRCGIVAADGRTHAEHGMVGEIVIE